MGEKTEPALLKAEKLSFSYGNGGLALQDVDLTVKKGERIAVLGSNGAGKSTLFLNLNGVLTPASGNIYYDGKEITKKNRNELRKHVGIVFQEADNQIIAATVTAEVSFGPMNLKLSVPEVKNRVDEALSCMNLTGLKERPPHYLSGGEKKRVCIADIIAMGSEVFLFDEPTASLDPFNEAVFETVLEKLQRMGKTILISTHDVDFAWRWAKRAVVFAGGRIIADDTPLHVFQDDRVVKQANLRRPILFEVCQRLAARGLTTAGAYAISPEDLEKMLCGPGL